MTHKPTPEERAADRYQMTDCIAESERRDYAACLREVADPLEAERDSLRETVQVLVNALAKAIGYVKAKKELESDTDRWAFYSQRLASVDAALARAAEKHNITPKP